MTSGKPPSFEVRILSGLHKGAACPLEQSALLGALPDCDIVLSDAGVPPVVGRLRADGRGWRLEYADLPDPGSFPGAEGEPAWVRPGHPLAIGSEPVWITVAEAGAPWADAPPGASPVAEEDDQSALGPGDAARGAERVPHHPTRHRSRSGALLLSVCLFGGLAAAGSVAMWLQADSTPGVDEAAGQTGLTYTRALIARAEPAGSVRAVQDPDGTIRVIGWVETEAELQRIQGVLAALRPAPKLAVVPAPKLGAMTLEALQKVPVRYEARYVGDGHVIVTGIAPDEAGRAAALAAAQAKLPGVRITGDKIMLAAEVEQDLAIALQQSGIQTPALSWKDNRLLVEAAQLSAADRDRAAAEVKQFNTTRFDVAMVTTDTTQAPPTKPTLPFALRSVVGGDQPWVIVDDGTKVLVGGTYDGIRLTAINDHSVSFEGPKSTIIVVPR